MIAIRNDMVKVGDFLRFTGSQSYLRTAWWKADRIEGDTIHLVDRHGATARVRTTRRFHESHALKWEPGDDRNDDR